MSNFVFYIIFFNLVGGCTGAVKIESSNEPIDIDDEPIDVDCGGKGIFCTGFFNFSIFNATCPHLLNSCRRDQFLMQGKQ